MTRAATFRALLLCLALLSIQAIRAPAQAVSPGRILTLDQAIALLGASGVGSWTFRWDPFLREGSFAAGGHYGAFPAAESPGTGGFLLLNGTELHPVPLPYFNGGDLVFPEAFVTAVGLAFSRVSGGSSGYRIAAVIIDPGHGGKDPGAVFSHTVDGSAKQVRESDITLAASRMLKDMLAAKFPDKRIMMTRERDIFLALEDRTAIANSVPVRDNEAIIFISIHANYAANRNARGFEVWHITPDHRRDVLDASRFPDADLRRILNLLTEESFRSESVMVARSILDGLQSAVGESMPNRGLRAENWFVVRRSNMPAVLVELGFVSNREDAMMMTGDLGLRRLMGGVFGGVVDFVETFERSGGFTIAQ